MTVPPDVTVIIPVYNTVDYLRPCLDSLVGQTINQAGDQAGDRERLEVVAVDDGSTDGSGELLEEYAAAYPGLFRVVHQENSGGPAGPCNVGLEHATGRFVFFLGSDDYLSLDALERLVERADAWEADVVVPPAEGVGGRYVDQRLFKVERPDLAFPGDLLPYSISNTKLFRRSLLEEHGIRYPLDLRVGSDQPFTVAAMLAARRIGVVPRPSAYFAVKRADQSNITYRTDWRTRLADITAIVDHLCEIVPAGPDRDALLARHFDWEFDKIITRDLLECGEDDAAELVTALQALADRLLTEGLEARLPAPCRLRWHLVRTGDRAALAEAARNDARTTPLVVTADGVFLRVPALAPGDGLLPMPHNLARWLRSIEYDARIAVDGTRLVLTSTTAEVDPASTGRLMLALSPLNDRGVPRLALDLAADKATRVLASGPVDIGPDGAVRAEIDLTSYVEAGGGRAGLRLRIVTPDRVVDRPVRIAVDQHAEVDTRSWRGTIGVTSSTEDRVVVAVDVQKTLTGRVLGRLGR